MRWRTALVTGASSGIGRAFARELAARGSDVVVVARRVERLEELATEIRAAHDVEVEILPADLTDPDGLGGVEKRLREGTPRVDLLVNNAGMPGGGRFVKRETDDVDTLVRLNVLAVVRLTHAALGSMTERGDGGVINVSSMAGFQAIPMSAVYSASKAFVTTFTEGLAEEVRASGVRMVALCPGFVRTEFHPDEEIESGPLPARAFMEPEPVVRAGLRALASGQVVCVPGTGWKVARLASQAMPRSVLRRALGRAAGKI
jgi:uncharacterized protein